MRPGYRYRPFRRRFARLEEDRLRYTFPTLSSRERSGFSTPLETDLEGRFEYPNDEEGSRCRNLC
jgi:hypothetical protein